MHKILGNEKQVSNILSLIKKDSFPISSLLDSVEHAEVNKIAMFIARMLLCTGDKNYECKCLSCRKVQNGVNHDLHVVTPDNNTIKNDDIKDIIKKTFLKPQENKVQVFLILEADKMNINSENRLLKTLEDTPRDTYFILTTSNSNNLLDTTKSRLATFFFGMPTKEEILFYISNLSLNKQVPAYLIQSRSIKDIDEYLNDEYSIDYDAILDFTEYCIVDGAMSECKALLDKLRKKKNKLSENIRFLSEIIHDAYMLKVTGNNELVKNIKSIQTITKISEKKSKEAIYKYNNKLITISNDIEKNVSNEGLLNELYFASLEFVKQI